MSKNVVIIGASGHGKVIADIVLKSGDNLIGFLDDHTSKKELEGIPVLGQTNDYVNFNSYFLIAIGSAEIRKKIANRMQGVSWYTAIHPSASISIINTHINEGTVIMANAVINSGTTIGKHCIINSAAVVEHDNVIEDFVHVSVGANLGGNVKIGGATWVGIGSTINNNITICSGCLIGAGSVVVDDINEPGTYFGVPVKKRQSNL